MITRTIPHRIVLKRDLKALTGFEATRIREMMEEGTFPKPVRLGERRLGWLESEIISWQQAKIAERDRAERKRERVALTDTTNNTITGAADGGAH